MDISGGEIDGRSGFSHSEIPRWPHFWERLVFALFCWKAY